MGDTVLVAANDHHLYAIDAATGRLRWRYHAENEVMSQPAYDGNTIYVGIGNASHVVYDPPHFAVVGTGMNKLEAVDAQTGVESWWSGLDGTGMPSQAIVGNEVVAADGAGTVLAVDTHTGRYLWDTRLPSAFAMSSVASDNGFLYLGGHFQTAIYALRASNGAVQWVHHFSELDGGTGDGPLAMTQQEVVGDYLEPLAPGPFGAVVTWGSRALEHVYALSRSDGQLLWDSRIPGAAGIVPKYNEASIPLIYRKTIYVGSPVAPLVSALDLNGHLLWQQRVHGPVKGGIAARDGTLYFGDLSGYLWGLDARTGRAIGSLPTDMQFNTGSPIIVNDSLVVGGREDVIAIPLEDIRDSEDVPGVTHLTFFESFARSLILSLPHRDPHLEASYRHH